jgi:hypothetical protein
MGLTDDIGDMSINAPIDELGYCENIAQAPRLPIYQRAVLSNFSN